VKTWRDSGTSAALAAAALMVELDDQHDNEGDDP
jgi:hypothetical protein